MRRALCAVALLALACLLLRAARVGLAGDYIDPISKITAQDEALYSHSAIAMAREGAWLTPRFMGRYALYKPPLLVWTAGVSAKLLGISRLSLRLPSAILSALALGLSSYGPGNSPAGRPGLWPPHWRSLITYGTRWQRFA